MRNLVQPECVLQGADDMFVAVTSSYLSPLLSLYETPAILIQNLKKNVMVGGSWLPT